MKLLSLITIHIGSNFGSALQTIATSCIFEHLNLNVQVVNYIPPRVTYSRYLKEAFSSLPKFLWRIFNFPNFVLNKIIYIGYIKKYCALSKPIYVIDNFAKKCPKADIYVTGSDQVWNAKYNEGIDTHYFFDGIVGTKIAYAASIGTAKPSDIECTTLKKHLSSYKAISVREQSAAHIIRSLGLSAKQVIDPTFMLDKFQWKKYATPQHIKYRYILVYIPYNIVDKPEIFRSVKKIAAKFQLKIITFSWNYFTDRYADKTIRYASPGDFLTLMYGAELVITNSFHGTAFSINLNKQFWVYMPSNFTNRISDMLELFGLKDRVLNNRIADEKIENQIDYTPINKILDIKRHDGYIFLKDALF